MDPVSSPSSSKIRYSSGSPFAMNRSFEGATIDVKLKY